jgi:uncharacterized protein YggE
MMTRCSQAAEGNDPLGSPKPALVTRIAASICVVFTTLALAMPSHAGETATLTIEGSGNVAVVPDQADITVSFEERGWDVADLESRMNGRVDRLIAALLKAGIDKNGIDSAHVRITPVSRYDQATRRQIQEGFELGRNVSINVAEIEKLGAILTAVSEQQVNQVSSPRLSFSDHEGAYQRALAMAVEQAQARAGVIAEAGGLELGPIAQITTPGSPIRPMPEGRLAMAASSDVGNYTPGEMLISATLSVTFALQSD